MQVRDSILEFFEGLFKEIIIAKDGQEAITLYEKDTFDIVISDIQMPNKNGIELSREILKQNKKQKVIIISAYNETKYFIELIKIGVAGFIQKPFSTSQMLDTLCDICLEIEEENNASEFVYLNTSFKWNIEKKVLSEKDIPVQLTANETAVLELFIKNKEQKFTDLEIFNHIYYNNIEKEFSSNAIKSLLKRLRKKIPQKLIHTHKNLGYSFKI